MVRFSRCGAADVLIDVSAADLSDARFLNVEHTETFKSALPFSF